MAVLISTCLGAWAYEHSSLDPLSWPVSGMDERLSQPGRSGLAETTADWDRCR
jgi:hypothetical protein